METKTITQASEKWIRRAGQAGTDYQNGVKSPKRSWREATAASEATYVEGVQAGIARGAFGKGVADKTDDDWKNMAIQKGAARYPEGVRLGEKNYQSGMSPVISKLQSITLPPRGSRGSPANTERSAIVQRELHQLRVGS